MEVLGFIAFFAMIFGIVYVYFSLRNKERMALIEKGAEASLFNTGKEKSFQFSWSKFVMKIGMFFMGIAVGIIMGAFFDSLEILSKEVSYVSMIFLFGGFSLVLFYIIDKKTSK